MPTTGTADKLQVTPDTAEDKPGRSNPRPARLLFVGFAGGRSIVMADIETHGRKFRLLLNVRLGVRQERGRPVRAPLSQVQPLVT
jgi:hypothetical protein